MCSAKRLSPPQVLEWINLLTEAWALSSNTLDNIDCQKRAVCEIWRWLAGAGRLEEVEEEVDK